MKPRQNLDRSAFRIVDLLAWVTGLAAFVSLVVEVIRLVSKEPTAALVGGLVILYVVYAAYSVRFLWSLPGVATPISLFIGGALWNLALRNVEKADLPRILIATIFIPLAMIYVVRLVDNDRPEEDELAEATQGPRLVHTLLTKGTKLGTLQKSLAGSHDLGIQTDIGWVGPLSE